jgi:hypothetical protein
MKHKYPILLVSALALWLVGCKSVTNYGQSKPKCVCYQNTHRGYATIDCQPIDSEVLQGQQAIFKVAATGAGLTYQWYFRGSTANCGVEVDPAQTTGGRTPKLTVLDIKPDDVGVYWCEIDSMGLWGTPARTRTRDAFLGIRKEPEQKDGGVQVYPAQQASMPPGNSGNVCGGSYCGYVNYQNGGNGFNPDPGCITGWVEVRKGTGAPIPNTTFHLKWFDDLGGTGCAANSTADPERKEFLINANRIYFFTVYFKPGQCPPAGTTVFLDLQFRP